MAEEGAVLLLFDVEQTRAEDRAGPLPILGEVLIRHVRQQRIALCARDAEAKQRPGLNL